MPKQLIKSGVGEAAGRHCRLKPAAARWIRVGEGTGKGWMDGWDEMELAGEIGKVGLGVLDTKIVLENMGRETIG